jgi:hypothetical protein
MLVHQTAFIVAKLQVAKVLAEYREGIWDSAARDPNDEMIRGNRQRTYKYCTCCH